MAVLPDTVSVMNEAWDCLVILDACRYDYFERLWRDYFDSGELSCRSTIGTATVQWRDRSFTGRYEDVVYVSANPYINSRKSVKGFCGGEHFHKVYDVWAHGWDERLGTVPPEAVTTAAAEAAARHADKRLIVHYLQPHAPYLSLGEDCRGFPTPDVEQPDIMTGLSGPEEDSKFQRKLLARLLPLAERTPVFGHPAEWTLRRLLRMSPKSPMDAALRKVGRRGLRKAYEANLRRVLAQVIVLLPHLHGRVVVTSDHGERLGEWRQFTHVPDSDSRYLRHIPWLVLDRPPRAVGPGGSSGLAPGAGADPTTGDEQSKIEQRLRSLGYID